MRLIGRRLACDPSVPACRSGVEDKSLPLEAVAQAEVSGDLVSNELAEPAACHAGAGDIVCLSPWVRDTLLPNRKSQGRKGSRPGQLWEVPLGTLDLPVTE